MKLKVYQFFVALFASFGSFLYGYDLGVIASVVASDSFVHKFLESSGSTKSGTVVALFTGGEFDSILEASSWLYWHSKAHYLVPSVLDTATLSAGEELLFLVLPSSL